MPKLISSVYIYWFISQNQVRHVKAKPRTQLSTGIEPATY